MKEIFKTFAISITLTTIFLQFARFSEVSGVSMEPSFSNNDILVVSRQAYRNRIPQNGDVVIFQSDLLDKNGKDKLLIKRVIAVPGDHIVVTDGKVIFNGKTLDEPYIMDGITNGDVDVVVPENYVFCMGDNRLHSMDSRFNEIGLVNLRRIKGRVEGKVWPLSQIGRIQKIENVY